MKILNIETQQKIANTLTTLDNIIEAQKWLNAADQFHWDNHLENDTTRVLQLKESKFFKVFEGEDFNIENRVRELLSRYTDFDFSIDLKPNRKIVWKKTILIRLWILIKIE
jgi:hypothetical protein